jgi:hypothetical protein
MEKIMQSQDFREGSNTKDSNYQLFVSPDGFHHPEWYSAGQQGLLWVLQASGD